MQSSSSRADTGMKGDNKLTAALADAVLTTSRRCNDETRDGTLTGRSANAAGDMKINTTAIAWMAGSPSSAKVPFSVFRFPFPLIYIQYYRRAIVSSVLYHWEWSACCILERVHQHSARTAWYA